MFFYVDEWVRYTLSIIHDKFLWLYIPHFINKEVIRVVTSFCSTGPILVLKFVKNEIVMDQTGVKYDKRSLTTKDIRNPKIKYALIMIGCKLYFTNRENPVSTTTINMTYEMVEKGEDYDLCELLKLKLLENLQKIKDSKYDFKFGTLIICSLFYFLNEVPKTKNVVWLRDRPIAHQIRDYLFGLGDSDFQKNFLWGFFKIF